MKFLMGGIRYPVFAADVSYDRPKLVAINATPININFLAGEEPTALAAITADNSGSTGILNLTLTADADPTVGVDIQDLFRIEDIQVTIDQATGTTTLTASIIPVLGGATDGTAQAVSVQHSETMDAWQTAAGVARAV